MLEWRKIGKGKGKHAKAKVRTGKGKHAKAKVRTGKGKHKIGAKQT